jgi:hypothetical protein
MVLLQERPSLLPGRYQELTYPVGDSYFRNTAIIFSPTSTPGKSRAGYWMVNDQPSSSWAHGRERLWFFMATKLVSSSAAVPTTARVTAS